MPLRHLMTLQAELAGSDAQGMTGKIDAALAFTQRVVDSGAQYFRANPAVAERLKGIKGQNRHYLAHEYFNRDWLPMPFSQVAELLGAAKLNFAASANLLDSVDEVCLSAEGRQLLAEIGHPVLRKSVRDYFVNQQFRKDIFVKGPRTLAPLQRFDFVRIQSFVLIIPPAEVPMKIPGPIGEISLQEAIYKPLVEIMAENGHAPKSVKQLLDSPELEGTELAHALAVPACADGQRTSLPYSGCRRRQGCSVALQEAERIPLPAGARWRGDCLPGVTRYRRWYSGGPFPSAIPARTSRRKEATLRNGRWRHGNGLVAKVNAW